MAASFLYGKVRITRATDQGTVPYRSHNPNNKRCKALLIRVIESRQQTSAENRAIPRATEHGEGGVCLVILHGRAQNLQAIVSDPERVPLDLCT